MKGYLKKRREFMVDRMLSRSFVIRGLTRG